MSTHLRQSRLYCFAAKLLVHSYPSLKDVNAFCIRRSWELLLQDRAEISEPKSPISLTNSDDLGEKSSPISDLLDRTKSLSGITSEILATSIELVQGDRDSLDREETLTQVRILEFLHGKARPRKKAKLAFLSLICMVALVTFLVAKKNNVANWKAEYFENPDLRGEPSAIIIEQSISHNWNVDPPLPGFPPDNFSARWTTEMIVHKPTEFSLDVTSDDGVRVFLNEEEVINAWFPQAGVSRNFTRDLTPGTYQLKVEYFELGAGADINVNIKSTPPNRLSFVLPQPK